MPGHNEKPASVYQTTYEALLKKYQHGSSKLKPQVNSWEEDLPGVYENHQTSPRATYINSIKENWLEIPRFESVMWHGTGVLFFICLTATIVFSLFFIHAGFFEKSGFLIFAVLGIFIYLSMTCYFWRMAVFVPRGTPVRFNRARQKVYVYEYKRSWNPWVCWRAEVKVFDWADIHGEMIRQIGRYDSGHRLSCAVCKPGTFEVIDRFMLSWTVGHPKMLRGLWSFCCHYMNYQPVPERPLIAKHPRSWCPRNNIHWPEAIDHESTTAP